MLSKRKVVVIWMGIMLAMFAAGCKKKAPPPPPPPPPPKAEEPAPPKAPMIDQFSAEPSSIERGQSATLRWSVSNATDISIDNGIGTIDATGSRQVFPNNSTTYTLTAKGPVGSTSSSATVNVTVPAPPPPPPMDEVETAYYLRLRALDRPGVLADVTRICADLAISIDAIFQKEAGEGEEQVDVVILTHRTRERDINAALRAIDALPTIPAPVVRIRLEELL